MPELMLSLIEAAERLMELSGHLPACPEYGSFDDAECPCGLLEARAAMKAAIAEANSAISSHTL
jgi:hypothetical protein